MPRDLDSKRVSITPQFNPPSRRFLYVLKLADLDGAFRELGGDFEFSALGFDEILERAHVHIRAALELDTAAPLSGENSLTRSGCGEEREVLRLRSG
jgi:hypothetical protein